MSFKEAAVSSSARCPVAPDNPEVYALLSRDKCSRFMDSLMVFVDHGKRKAGRLLFRKMGSLFWPLLPWMSSVDWLAPAQPWLVQAVKTSQWADWQSPCYCSVLNSAAYAGHILPARSQLTAQDHTHTTTYIYMTITRKSALNTTKIDPGWSGSINCQKRPVSCVWAWCKLCFFTHDIVVHFHNVRQRTP